MILLALLLAGELEQGQASWDGGDPAGALVHWSLALKEARDAGDVEGEQEVLLRLAMVHRELGKLKEAEELVRMAGLERADEALSLGLIRLHAGLAEEAEALFQEAFGLEQAAGDVPGAANAALNLGNARMALGHPDTALKAWSGALALFTAMGDPGAASDAQMNVGIAQRHLGDYVAAEASLQAALATAADPRAVADAHVNLALLYQELGRDEPAERHYEEALRVAQGLKDVGRQATILLDMGTFAHERGEVETARRRYDLAEEAFREVGREADARACALNRARLDRNPAALRKLMELGARDGHRVLEAAAAVDLATLIDEEAPARRALELSETLELSDVRWRARALVGGHQLRRGDPAGVESLKEAVVELEAIPREDRGGLFLLEQEQVYERLVGALVAEGRLGEAMATAQTGQVQGNPLVAEAPGELAALQQRQRWVEGQLGEELATNGDTERSELLRQELSRLRVEFAGEVDRLRATHPDFDQLVRVDPEDLEALQADLDPGVVVLQPVLLGDRLVLMVFHREGLRAVEVEVDGQQVARTVSRLTRSLRARMIDEPEWTEGLCDQLGQWLLEPIAQELEGASVLVVTPGGPFQQLPFSLLRRDGRYLVQDMAVASVTHVGSLKGGSPYRLVGEELLLVGNPDGTLPAAEEEVRGIGGSWPGASVHLGEMDRETLQGEVEGKTTLHLATHGVVDPGRPDASYLVVGPNQKLAYREIPGMAPYLGRARLVVLSACESGLPVVAPDSAGQELAISINGLSAQFRRAGVETLVASMWKVDDEGTRRLMEGFYANLAERHDVAESLRLAQLALVESEDMGHPWYWGAFVVMGDWR